MTDATLQFDRADLAKRYDRAVQKLATSLCAARKLDEADRRKLTDVIQLRRKVNDLNGQPDDDAFASALTTFEQALADLQGPAMATDQMARFFAWFEGDKEKAVPPPLPKPTAPETKPSQKGRRKPAPPLPAEPPPSGKETPPLRAEPSPGAQEEQQAGAFWVRRWVRRAAIILLFLAGVSGLRDAERRAVLSQDLALDRFSFEEFAGWAADADWVTFGGRLGGFVVGDVSDFTSSTARLAGAVIREVTKSSSEPAELVVAEPANPTVTAAPTGDTAANAVDQAIEEAVLRTEAADTQPTARPQAAQPPVQPPTEPGDVVPRAMLEEAERQVAVLREQVSEMQHRLLSMQAILEEQKQQEEQNRIQLQDLGARLNTALAQAAIAERESSARLEAENAKLRKELDDLYVLMDEEAEIAAITPTHRVSGTLVNARAGPGTQFEIVSTLPSGTLMILLDRSGDWGKFRDLSTAESFDVFWVFMGLTNAVQN